MVTVHVCQGKYSTQGGGCECDLELDSIAEVSKLRLEDFQPVSAER